MAVGFVNQRNDLLDARRFVDTSSMEHNLLIINEVDRRWYRWPWDHGTRCFECNDASGEIRGYWDRIVFVTHDIANAVIRLKMRRDYLNAFGSIPWIAMVTTSPATANSLLSSTSKSAVSAVIREATSHSPRVITWLRNYIVVDLKEPGFYSPGNLGNIAFRSQGNIGNRHSQREIERPRRDLDRFYC